MNKHVYNAFLYLTVFVVGAVILIIEILGTRIMSPFYGSTIYVWSSLITVTLGALALGYWIGGRVADSQPKAALYYWFVVVSGVLCVMPVKVDQFILPLTSGFGLQYGPLVAALLLFFTPLLALGTISPFTIKLLFTDPQHSGRVAGRVFSIGTIGSILGGLISAFVLLPLFSLNQIFTVVGVVLIATGVVGFLISSQNRSTIKSRGKIFTVLVLLLAVLFIPKYVIAKPNNLEVIHQRQSIFGDIKVVNFPGADYSRCLFVNGSGQTCINSRGETDGFFQRYLKDQVSALNLKTGDRILLLGLGGGGILSILPDDVYVDVVELDPDIYKVASIYFKIPKKDNVNFIIDDARHFLATAPHDTYDVVIEDIALGSSIPSYILSQESFDDMHRVLTDDGSLFVHLGTHEINGDKKFTESVYITALSQFNYGVAYSSQQDYIANALFNFSDIAIKPITNYERHIISIESKLYEPITDSHNTLDGLYLSNALSQRENLSTLSNLLLFVQ